MDDQRKTAEFCREAVAEYKQRHAVQEQVISFFWALVGLALLLASASASFYLCWRLIRWL